MVVVLEEVVLELQTLEVILDLGPRPEKKKPDKFYKKLKKKINQKWKNYKNK